VILAQEWAPLDAWLALPPEAPGHRCLALLGGPGSGKSTAAAAAAVRLVGGAGVVCCRAMLCR
jgi:hypothetical protein